MDSGPQASRFTLTSVPTPLLPQRGRDHNTGDLGKQAVKRPGRLLVVSLYLRHKTPPPLFKDGLGLSNDLQMYGCNDPQ